MTWLISLTIPMLVLGGFVSLMELHIQLLYMAMMITLGYVLILASLKFDKKPGGDT